MKGLGWIDRKLRVLIADDDEDDYLITRDLLSQIGRPKFHADWAPSYRAALQAIELNQHDIYLFDYRLGEGDGLELLREALARGCKAPIILLTGNRRLGNRRRGHEGRGGGLSGEGPSRRTSPGALHPLCHGAEARAGGTAGVRQRNRAQEPRLGAGRPRGAGGHPAEKPVPGQREPRNPDAR